jgi:hypothetical protein
MRSGLGLNMRSSGRRVVASVRRLGPWLLASIILAFLTTRVPFATLRTALDRGPALSLIGYVFIQVMLTLVADSLATRVSFSCLGLKFSFPETLMMRGASYLLGLINYGLGQTGIAYYLTKRGVTSMLATSAVLFTIVTTLLALVVVTLIGASFVSTGPTTTYARTAIVISLVGVCGYLSALKIVHRRYIHNSFALPLVEAGVAGHLWATVTRLPHVFVLVGGHWGAMYLWGIVVPFVEGFGLIALTLLVASLPISPNGLGTTQAVQVLFFSQYVHASVSDERAAILLAFSLFYYACGILAQGIVGFACLVLSNRPSTN